jgi:hypothetical protein
MTGYTPQDRPTHDNISTLDKNKPETNDALIIVSEVNMTVQLSVIRFYFIANPVTCFGHI